MIEVSLTPDECHWAYSVGVARHIDARKNGQTHKAPGPGQAANGTFRIGDDCLGAAGELAFCKAEGITWPATIGYVKGRPDVPPDWEIKTVQNPKTRLYVRTHDRPHFRFVRVIGTPPNLQVIGWIRADEAQSLVPLTDPYGGQEMRHWVPDHVLIPFL